MAFFSAMFVVLLVVVILPTKAWAKMNDNNTVVHELDSVSVEGVKAANCLGCHQQSDDKPIHAIFQNPHGNLKGKNNETCITCHGSSESHGEKPRENSPSLSFGPRWPAKTNKQSNVCLTCHQKGEQAMWSESVHHDEELACTNCHTLHINKDPILDKITQVKTCGNCHTNVRSAINLKSHHPIREGQVTCTDCHNPHGSLTESSLKAATLNDTCFSCHAEKRGPFLFEHAPVSEECTSCHTPHGSVNDNLLTTRGPFLCQQCHSVAFHPSTQQDGSGLARGKSPSEFLLGKNCLNCHSKIHGSNHPSGSRFTR
jgi:DmsE family decaheme c-type cytochrome